jgi:hypothetical protein
MSYATYGQGDIAVQPGGAISPELLKMMELYQYQSLYAVHCKMGMDRTKFQLAYASAYQSGGQNDAEYQAYLAQTRQCMTSPPISYTQWKASQAAKAAAAAERAARVEHYYQKNMALCIERGGFPTQRGTGPMEPCTEQRVREWAERDAMMLQAGLAVAAPVRTNGKDSVRRDITQIDPALVSQGNGLPPGTDISDVIRSNGAPPAPLRMAPRPKRGAGWLWLGAAAAAGLAMMR